MFKNFILISLSVILIAFNANASSDGELILKKNQPAEVEDCFENLKISLVRMPKDFESANFWLNKAYMLRDACNQHSISLKKAAIQFPYFNTIVSSVILGMNSKLQVEENYKDYNEKINSKPSNFNMLSKICSTFSIIGPL